MAKKIKIIKTIKEKSKSLTQKLSGFWKVIKPKLTRRNIIIGSVILVLILFWRIFLVKKNTWTVQTIVVKAVSKEAIPQAIAATKKYFLNQGLTADDLSVLDQSNLLSTINSILGVLTAALGGIAAISLVVGGVGIMNIMLVSVTERTREIGLRKAVGAKPKDILIQFLIEAVTLSVLGGTIGILIGAGGAAVINKFFPTSVPAWAVILAFSVSALVGIVFGVAPAVSASKLNPIDALRYE